MLEWFLLGGMIILFLWVLKNILSTDDLEGRIDDLEDKIKKLEKRLDDVTVVSNYAALK